MASIEVNHSTRFSLAVFLLISMGWCGAQQCRDSLDDSDTDQRFEQSEDGKIIDHHSHLVWRRCSIGQLWDNNAKTCIGEAQSLTWMQAKQLANNQTNSEYHWRLPSVVELSSITKLSCYNPAIDLQLFPQTPASHYWTSTPFANKAGHYWLVQFLSGENHTDSEKRPAFARLVKTLEQSTQSH